jgi:hypothetical protein
VSISGGTDYTEGSVIEYEAFGNVCRRVKVEAVKPGIKRGRPGFDGTIVSGPEDGQPAWGYDSQVTKVISR